MLSSRQRQGTGRRIGGSKTVSQRRRLILEDAYALYSSLLTSLVPETGQLASFSRSSTATVTDFEGQLLTVKSGEARFEGARRVENLYNGYTNISVSTISNTDGSYITTGFTSFNSSRVQPKATGSTLIPGYTTISGIELKAAVPSDIGKKVLIRVWDDNGGTLSAGTVVILTDSYTKYAISKTYDGATGDTFIWVYGNNTNNASGVQWRNVQIEEAIGTQVTPSEYVSNGALPAPYHGANVDGVKYFNTDRSGNPIPDATLKGVMNEYGSTNLSLNSDDAGANYFILGATRGGSSSIAASTLQEFVEDSALGSHLIAASSIAKTGNTTYTESYFLKRGIGTDRKIALITSSGVYLTASTVLLDLTSGIATLVSGSPVSYGVENIGNGVYRLWVTDTTIAAPSGGTAVFIADLAGATSYQGNGTSSVFVGGYQIEAQTFPTSYIPTSGATGSRGVERLDEVNPVFMQGVIAEYTIALEFDIKFDPTLFTASQNWFFSLFKGTTDKLGLYVDIHGKVVALAKGNNSPFSTSSALPISRGKHMIALRITANTLSFFIDGAKKADKVNINNPVFTSVQTTFSLGSEYNSSNNKAMSTIKNLKVYKKALSDAKCLELTV